jgi:cobalt-zinc-cadmium efflux system protein
MVGSIGVIIAALVIRFTGWSWVDSLVAAGIGFWVLPRTWSLLKESMNILLQGVPEGIDIQKVEANALWDRGVKNMHDLHIWALTSGKSVMSVHLVADSASRSEQDILTEVTLMSEEFQISHTTVQMEGF